MALALPVQGMSATLMLGCESHHQGMQQVLAAHQATAHLAASKAYAHVHEHAAAHEHDHVQTPTHDMPLVSADAKAPHAASCSACALCCLVLALPMHFALPEAQALAQPPQSALLALIPSRSPDRLDRPPRNPIA